MAQIDNAIHLSLFVGITGLLLSSLFVLAILWRTMTRLHAISRVLPLIADSAFGRIREALSQHSHRHMRDELDTLSDSILMAADRLEGLQHRDEENERRFRTTDILARLGGDEFGVGFSSFYYLRELPIEFVKIDGSLIRNLSQRRDDQAVVRALTEIAKAFHKRTIAEFVETPAILELLQAYGVEYAQGDYIGKPAADLGDSARMVLLPTGC